MHSFTQFKSDNTELYPDISTFIYRLRTISDEDGKCKTISNNVPFEGLKDLRLIIFCIVYGLYTLGIYVPVDFLPIYMVKEHGISPLQAGSVISIYGISNTMGQIIAGGITQCVAKSALILTSISMWLLGFSCILMANSTTYWQFVLCISTYGIASGMCMMLRPISLVDMFGVGFLKKAYGLVVLFSGGSSLISAPMAGWLKVVSGTYCIAFYAAAGVFTLAGILGNILFYIDKKIYKAQ